MTPAAALSEVPGRTLGGEAAPGLTVRCRAPHSSASRAQKVL